MGMQNFLAAFLVYSFLGWMIDTTFRSVVERRFVSRNLLGIPLTPIYGLGACLILIIHSYLTAIPLVAEWLTFGIILTTWEYLGGVFCVRILHRRLWKYTEPLSIGGHTNLFCIPLWGALALAVVYMIQPVLERYI